ncbi:hypothetical protein D3C75_1290270 [compost metagenome]
MDVAITTRNGGTLRARTNSGAQRPEGFVDRGYGAARRRNSTVLDREVVGYWRALVLQPGDR